MSKINCKKNVSNEKQIILFINSKNAKHFFSISPAAMCILSSLRIAPIGDSEIEKKGLSIHGLLN